MRPLVTLQYIEFKPILFLCFYQAQEKSAKFFVVVIARAAEFSEIDALLSLRVIYSGLGIQFLHRAPLISTYSQNVSGVIGSSPI